MSNGIEGKRFYWKKRKSQEDASKFPNFSKDDIEAMLNAASVPPTGLNALLTDVSIQLPKQEHIAIDDFEYDDADETLENENLTIHHGRKRTEDFDLDA